MSIPRMPDGAVTQDAYALCLDHLEEECHKKEKCQPNQEARDVIRHLTRGHNMAWAFAYAFTMRSSWRRLNFDVPEFATDAKFIKWSLSCGHAVPTRHLAEVCASIDQQARADRDPGWEFMSIGTVGSLRYEAPLYASACDRCRRMFFHDDVRRKTCNHCQRRQHRDKMRDQRGTDLSERLCLVCSTSFTPKRTDARCCSGRCRAKLSRQKAKA